MSVCFQLFPKGSDKAATFMEIDERLCKEFNVPVDSERYYKEWYNVEGFGLALGNTWEELKEKLPADRLPIINFLEANYEYSAWREMR